jgi:multidrug resistance efflux pump
MASRPDPALPKAVPRGAVPDAGALAILLQYEGELRRWPTVEELAFHLANETRRIVDYDQMFVLRQARVGSGFHVVAVSSLATVDRNAPLIRAVEKAVTRLAGSEGVDRAHEFRPSALLDDAAVDEYPFTFWRWQPLRDREGEVFAGLLVARGTAMRDAETVRLDRVAETGSHAWLALTGGAPVRRIRGLEPKEKRGLLVGLAVLALFPVQLTALAPVEVVAARPYVVAAPFSGVVEQILVPPNAPVRAGQPVIRFDDTKLRNDLQVAAEKLEVARTRVERSTNIAIDVREETREIALMRAEYELAEADHAYARDLLARTQAAAPRAGMALYSDRRDWEGRAVNVGDPIMQIIDPRRVEFRIDLPTREQMSLSPGGQVKVWLDAQPLWAEEARIETVSYQSRPTPEGVQSFAVVARPLGDTPRVGSRGTAKLYGRWVPLSYSLLRRPISSFRQFVGI